MKLFGAFLIFICSLFCGVYFSDRLKNGLFVCEKIYSAMKYVKDEICENKTPTKTIYERLGISADDGLYNAYNDGIKYLKDEEKEIFSDFCESIGKDSAQVQKGRFDTYLNRYEKLLETRRKEYANTKRIYLSLSVFCGVLIVIIFI